MSVKKGLFIIFIALIAAELTLFGYYAVLAYIPEGMVAIILGVLMTTGVITYLDFDEQRQQEKKKKKKGKRKNEK